MTKFEQVGVNLQYDAASIRHADRNFKYSCETCCIRNMRIECNRCAISATHDLVVASFKTAVNRVTARP